MTFDPDKALIKARESVHGFYMDGPSEAESRIEHLERVVSALFRQERKLKLERLMYKCQHRLTWLSDYIDSAPYGEERDVWEAKYDRCYKIYNGCFNALEVLNK